MGNKNTDTVSKLLQITQLETAFPLFCKKGFLVLSSVILNELNRSSSAHVFHNIS